jgi:hypothetical protein
MFVQAREDNWDAAIFIYELVLVTLNQMYVEITFCKRVSPDTRQGGNEPLNGSVA